MTQINNIAAIWQTITAAHGVSFVADTIKESFDKATSAQLPESLNEGLVSLCLAVGKLAESSPEWEAWQGAKALKRLVEETSQESFGPHWWEISLDNLTKVAKKQGEAGLPLLELVAALRPLLEQRFGPYGAVNLREVTEENLVDIVLLSNTLSEPKNHFVAPNAFSIAQAHYSDWAWFRAIYAGEAPVGFMMLRDDPEAPEYFLWRFMIAEPYHGRGFGCQAIELLVEYVKTRPGAKELLVSCGQGEGGPEGFYRRLGFVPNGNRYGPEIGLSLALV